MSSIVDLYKKEDEYVILNNNDEDLFPIPIKLPSLTEWYSKYLGREVSWGEAITYVDGYGLHPNDQVFKHQQVPERIKLIYETTFNKLKIKKKYKEITEVSQEDLYDEIESNPIYYKEEIKWMKTQIKRVIYTGYWCFIKGKPTYLNPPFYFFLNFWKLKNKNRKDSLPDYRNYQREMFTGLYYAHTTDDLFYKHRVVWRGDDLAQQETLFNEFQSMIDFERELKQKGIACFHQAEVTGGIWRKNPNGRTCNGINLISGRRIAKTDSACCFGYWATIRIPEQLFVIQGLNKEQAVDKVFIQKIQVPVSKLPFFFRPHIRGREDAKAGMTFLYDGETLASYRAGVIPEPHGGRILPLSSNERAADGEEANIVYIDEPGKRLDKKAQERDIPSLWYEVLKPATEIGSEIVGTCIMPTTVGEMESGGGDQFLRIVNDSHFDDRTDNGTTVSGLLNIFLSGYYAIPGFIDKWGFTVMETPKFPVISNTGKSITMGAREWHENQIKHFEKNKQWEKLNTHNRNFPPSFKAAFQLNMKGMGMTEITLQKMKNKVSDLRFSKSAPPYSRIDFTFIPNSENVMTEIHDLGRWVYSYLPPKQMWNQKTVVTEDEGYTRLGTKGQIYAPHTSVANKFVICFDPVKFDKMNRRGSGSSTPAAAVYYKRDMTVDPDTKPRDEWVSEDYVALIAHKTDFKEEIYEEVLKAAILYGAYIYPEANDANDFMQWIRKKGYDGYLLRDIDEKGKLASVPGVWADANTIGDMVTKMVDYFAHNVSYMKIPHIIEDWLKMKGVDDLTNRDIAAATGWCQRASAQRTGEVYKDWYGEVEIDDEPDMF